MSVNLVTSQGGGLISNGGNGIYHLSENAVFSRHAYKSCAAYTDAGTRPLESIRDQGTCLEAVKAFGTFTLEEMVLGYEDGVACSGCFLEYPGNNVDPLVARFCDYDPGANEGSPGDDVAYALVCIASASPSPPPPPPPSPSPSVSAAHE